MITAEDIAKANSVLPKVDIKGKNYVMVTERIKAFRQMLPEGTITTEILSMQNGIVTIQAKIFDENDHQLASGIAQEKESSSFINKTSFVENCETSAVGRALGMLGIGVDESMASAEEVATAMKNQGETSSSTGYSKPSTGHYNSKSKRAQESTIDPEAKKWQDKISEYANAHGLTTQEICNDYNVGLHSTAKRLEEVYNDLTSASTADSNGEHDYAALSEDEGPFS